MMGKFRKNFSTGVMWAFTFGSSNPQNLWLRAADLKTTFWLNGNQSSKIFVLFTIFQEHIQLGPILIFPMQTIVTLHHMSLHSSTSWSHGLRSP